MTDNRRDWSLSTRAAHAAAAREPGVAQPLTEPLYQSTVFQFESLGQLEDVYQQRASGSVYYRMGTPNTGALESSIADLEGGEAAVASASGMGVISALLLALAKSGDHLIADHHAYGGTYTLLNNELPRLGIETTQLDLADLRAVEVAFRPTTRALLVETLSNPTLRVADVPALCKLAQAHGVVAIVDSSFTTPCLIRPLELGADVVWHSLAKYLGGHSGTMGGIAVGRSELIEATRQKVVHFGASLGSFDAWMVGQGLPTLSLRMAAHGANAARIAAALQSERGIKQVLYPGLPNSPFHALATSLFHGNYGGMISFSLEGGARAAERFLGALDLIAFAPSLADVTTTVSYPVATSHRGLPGPVLDALGIDPGMIRLSVGIEDPKDILADLTRALLASQGVAAAASATRDQPPASRP